MYFNSKNALVETIVRQGYYALNRVSENSDLYRQLAQAAASWYYPSTIGVIRDGDSTGQSNGQDLVFAVMRAVAKRKEYIFLQDPAVHSGGEVVTTWRGLNIVATDTMNATQGAMLDFSSSWVRQFLTERPDGEDATGELDIVVQDNIRIIRPTAEALEALPAGARQFALRIGVAATSNSDHTRSWEVDDETGVATQLTGASAPIEIQGGMPTAGELIEEARVAYRQWLRATMGRSAIDTEEIARREAARKASAERFSLFARRTADEEKHVPTLPFVPHGLSSSRRWGIEVESGGARGLQAPAQWRRIGDSSLRSAWDGYKEVQDFEPYDETVEEFIRSVSCPTNAARHRYEVESYNNVTDVYEYAPNPDYMNPADCEACGPTTRVEHRTPQTITHRAQRDDCGEFVSPILVSMHSNGLKQLTNELIKQPQNTSSGVHVHVEADDLTNEQVATLIFGYDILEPLLESSYQRGETRRYCQRRQPQDVLGHARKLRSKQEITQREVRGGDRYVTLNTTALDAHGTIEFRAMGAVYDYDYLVRWAMLCRELVNLAAAGVTTKQFSRIKTWNDLTMLLAEYGKEYMRAAVYEATGEVGAAADLVKRGADVTTAALNSDLNYVFTNEGASISSMVNRLTASIEQVQARLVTVGSNRVSNTWAV